ncbi:MAG: ABC transporter substrate-binding protein [Patescibacteria group bacterium]
MTVVPVNGGTIEEGVIGYATSINPVLAYTDADKDVSALVYSGLLRATANGLQPDLAKSVTLSDDGKTYDIIIRDNATFHDGTAVTADDVLFTIEKINDPVINSPKAASWSGVTLEKVSEKEVRFTIKTQYAGFSENLTLGILPKHLWNDVEPNLFSHSTYNQEPIGSGPYRVKSSGKNSSGLYEYYDLVPFDDYVLGRPHIGHLIIRFFNNEESAVNAYKGGDINTIGGISPESAQRLALADGTVKRIPLPRTFAIFFNESNAPVLLNTEVRQALNITVDRNALIQDILYGFGLAATGPIPAGFVGEDFIPATNSSATSTSNTSLSTNIEKAKALLANKGWKANTDGVLEKVTKSGTKSTTEILKFSISTSNVPELKRTAELVAAQWKAIGADVSLEIFESSDLNQKIIRTRKYDTLLFGTAIGRDLDLYPFWHSSQRNYPGLNIALYTNLKADKFLEQARSNASSTIRDIAYQGFEKEVATDIPAVFLYSPQYIYIVPEELQNVLISNITSPSERFMNVNQWYVETEKIWNIFVRQK